MSGFKRLPNNYGTICKLSGKRRKPYCAKKYVGKEIVGERVIYKYKVIGTYETRREALSALADANLNGFDKTPDLTFEKVFEEFIDSRDVSQNRIYSYRSAKKKFSPLWDRKFKTLRVSDYEPCLEGVTKSTATLYKTVLGQVYEYAIAHDYVDKNYAQLISLPSKKYEPKTPRKVWTRAEVAALDRGDPIDAMVLVMLYTGMRGQEVQRIALSSVDMDGWFFRGVGLKTEAGKDRIVPIHPEIRSLVAEYAALASEKGYYGLFFADPDKIPGYYLTTRINAKFEGRHTSHDCRHTFATNAFSCRMNSVIVKLIMGHAVKDITLGTYTHILPEDLQEEMGKYRIT